MKRRLIQGTALLMTAALVWLLMHAAPAAPDALSIGTQRQLLRIWCASDLGGGMAWLRKQLALFEKQHPGVMTYLRTVSPEEITREGAVLPDMVLYTPGTFTAPQDYFLPIAGAEGLREPLLRCGRWKGRQYALPLCWGAYVMCIDGSADPQSAATPAPTTLLGRPAATPGAATTLPPYPYEAVMRSGTPLLAPSGCGTFMLCCLLEAPVRPALQDEPLSPADVYSRFRARQCASAVLTTGQLTALSSLASAGKAFPFRVMSPTQIITDQVWLGSVVQGAENSPAAALLAFLTASPAQQSLTDQGLYAARDMRLYFADTGAQVESAAERSLTAVNAFVPSADIASAAHLVYLQRIGLGEALLPLL